MKHFPSSVKLSKLNIGKVLRESKGFKCLKSFTLWECAPLVIFTNIQNVSFDFCVFSLSSKYLQVFEVLHYVGSCIIKVLKLKVKRVKSVWEVDEGRPRKKEDSARIARVHGLNPMQGSDGLQTAADPQETLRPFLEQITAENKENGTPILLMETELPRSNFIHARNVLSPEAEYLALSICE